MDQFHESGISQDPTAYPAASDFLLLEYLMQMVTGIRVQIIKNKVQSELNALPAGRFGVVSGIRFVQLKLHCAARTLATPQPATPHIF